MKIQRWKEFSGRSQDGCVSPERRDVLAVSLAGTLLVIPWELFMAFAFSFTFRAHEPLTTWLFVWFTFLLNIPAILSSWMWPRAGACWLIANVMASLAIGTGFELISIVQSKPGAPSAASEFFNGILGLIYAAVFFWGPPVVVAGGLLFLPLLTRLDGKPNNN